MPRADRVPFLPNRRLGTVHATLDDLTVLLIPDTGAERIVISLAIAERLGLDLNRPLRRESLIGIGQSLDIPVVRLNRVQVGASTASNIEASVFDLPRCFGLTACWA